MSQLSLSFVDGVETSIVATQSAIGCPWWLTIFGLTIGVRAIAMLPVTLYQQNKVAQLELLGPRLKTWGTAIAHRVMATGKDKGLTDQDAQTLINAQVSSNVLLRLRPCHAQRIWLTV
jgi:membrane protein insertase Oxa1/YidC/SpoIIIJ